MSLMHLLAATRSIVNIRDRRSPYEMRRQNLLPKFGPITGPDGKPGPALMEAGEDDAGAGPATPAGCSGRLSEAPSGESHMKNITGQNQLEPPPLPASEPPVRAAFPRGRWTILRARAAEPVPSEPATAQSELTLDCVKVVRNDLQEADLEVVLARKTPATPARAGHAGVLAGEPGQPATLAGKDAGAPSAPAPTGTANGTKASSGTPLWWGRLTSRLFGASEAVR